jgi:putative transposase
MVLAEAPTVYEFVGVDMQPQRNLTWSVVFQKKKAGRQNAFIESFNGRLRDELLNETLFSSLAYARAMLAAWQEDYNTRRPHSRLGWYTPAEYAASFQPRRAQALHSLAGSAPAPVTQPARQSKLNPQSKIKAG